MMFADYNITWMHTGGKARVRLGNFDPAVFPYTYIRCRDGYTFIAAYNDEAFDSLMHIIGRPELARDPRFSTPKNRVALENERALLEILEEWSGDRTADEILGAVEEYTSKRGGPGAAVVTGRVNRPLETLSEEHWRERGCFLRSRDPVYGELLLAAPPWKMSGTPARWKSGCRPPGSDNRDVYIGFLGMTGRGVPSPGGGGDDLNGRTGKCESPGAQAGTPGDRSFAREPLEGRAGSCLPGEGRQALPFLCILSSEFLREIFKGIFSRPGGVVHLTSPGLVD